MKAHIYKIIIITVSIFGSLFFALPAFAAVVSFVPSTQSLYENQEFSVDVMLDPEGQSINTVGLSIEIPDTLQYVSTNTALGIIGEWVDSPHFSIDTHHLVFSGIIPGGFAGYIDPFSQKNRKPGMLARITFQTTHAGGGTISAVHNEMYLNDGNGTQVTSTSTPLVFTVLHGLGVQQKKSPDIESPLLFVPVLVHDQLLYDGKYAIVFDTTDTGTGVRYFEVKEGSRDWIRAQSPYLLQDQTLSGQIFVRAVDGAGNMRTEVVATPTVNTRSRVVYNIIGVFVVLIILYAIIVWRRWVNSKNHTK